MGKAREISSEGRSAVVTLRNEGKFEREIALQLKLSKTCVHGTITRYRDTGTFQDRPRSGRPRATTSSEDHFIPRIRVEVNKTRVKPLSVTSVKWRLRDAKLYGRIAVRKPLLRPQNSKKRM
ncbi:unnamed protein product [Parnassius mnemosyne]|uniref:Paired domain-containing protein n=1 Tax=Parnassius mnemosyne TaxID=213953 RepID=A0AAV1LVL7_9NEOP